MTTEDKLPAASKADRKKASKENSRTGLPRAMRPPLSVRRGGTAVGDNIQNAMEAAFLADFRKLDVDRREYLLEIARQMALSLVERDPPPTPHLRLVSSYIKPGT
jgi:hypothetical protein